MSNLLDQLNSAYGCDDSGAAKLLGLDKGTISKYRSGTVAMPTDKQRHIETLLILDPATREQLKKDRTK